ncbi:MAG: cyclic nucleotide-binding domain-containing protein [Pseudomonadota bacterium]
MQELINYITSAVAFVHLATLCYILGLLTRRELVLRMFLLGGTGFYILYYYYISATPLWEAIATSILIGSANIPVIYRIFKERSTFGMSEEMLTLYQSFPNFNPGQFRRIMAEGEIINACGGSLLLEEGVEPDKLYLTTSDGFIVTRGTQMAEIGPGNFLGEIGFLLGGPATADVAAKPGSTYVAWDVSRLRKLMGSNEPISNAFSVLLNKDVASKLAVSFPVRATTVLREPAQL